MFRVTEETFLLAARNLPNGVHNVKTAPTEMGVNILFMDDMLYKTRVLIGSTRPGESYTPKPRIAGCLTSPSLL